MNIDQFMWAYQHIFRHSAGFDVKRALESIGANLEPEILLIGFAADDNLRHAVCIEPERGPLTQAHLDSVLERAAVIFDEDPETSIHHSHRPLHDRRQRWLYQRARALATCEAIESTDLYGHVRAWASGSTLIGGYDVHTVVLLGAEEIDSLPCLDDEMFDRQYVGRSLQHEVIAECLRRADRSLYLPDPGAGLNVLDATTEEIVGAAGRTFMRGCIVRSGEMLAGEPFDALCKVTSLSYERAGAAGNILFLGPEHSSLTTVITFERAVPLHQSRAIRKLLETTDTTTALLCDGSAVYGLGYVADDDSPDVFSVAVPAHATWQLNHHERELMRVSYGLPELPRPLLDRAAFVDTVQRVVGPADVDRLWTIIEAATASGHGATIVVSAEAAAEAARLSGQSTLIRPNELTASDVGRLGRIDGALLIDRNAVCFAVGVILDGAAQGVGDPSRGSRFNSSVRYQMAAPAPAVLVVVSDDGTIDLVPLLRRRVTRRQVSEVVQRFVDVASADEVEGELFARSYDAVRASAFYLDGRQCEVVNELYAAEQDRRFTSGGLRVMQARLEPNSQLDDSYFIDES